MHLNKTKVIALGAVAAMAIGVPTAGAAVQHFITGKDVKNNSLTGQDVKNRSLHSSDFDKKVQTDAEGRRSAGPDGATGGKRPRATAARFHGAAGRRVSRVTTE